MFANLTEKLEAAFTKLLGSRQLTESNIAEAVREVRLALLDADVSYTVTSNFIKRVKDKAVGADFLKGVAAGQQFIKVVHDELIALMGGEDATLEINGNPAVVLLCGLQGSGKTTQCAKLGSLLTKKEWGKKPLLAACDLQRPAAIEQLGRLAEMAGVGFFALEGAKDPVEVARRALEKARKEAFDVVILDTAGRLHIDEPLMEELEAIKKATSPQEILFVASATMGQDAMKVALEFDRRLSITGTILTMLDSTSRAGVALSIREVTQKPLKFEGVGEHLDDFQIFSPQSMADRILGMGDVINLVRRAQDHIDEKSEQKLEEKLRKAAFTYNDYLQQMGLVKKMGPLRSLLKMLPGGMGANLDFDLPEKEFKRTEAIILSMTVDERTEKVELVPSRRRRISKGSGAKIDDVNRLIKGFKRLKQMCRQDMGSLKQMMQQQLGQGKENSLWQ